MCMNQNYPYFFVRLAENIIYFLVCPRILVLSSCVPWEGKGWQSLPCSTASFLGASLFPGQNFSHALFTRLVARPVSGLYVRVSHPAPSSIWTSTRLQSPGTLKPLLNLRCGIFLNCQGSWWFPFFFSWLGYVFYLSLV